mgnify:CR=1 FL=1
MLNPIRKDVKTFCSIFFTIFFLIVSGMFWTAAIAQVIYNDQDHLRIETLPKSSEHFEKEFIKKSDKSFETIEWLDLMPKKNLDALLNPPDYVVDMEEGAFEDEILTELRNLPQDVTDSYQRALVSTEVIKEMDGKRIRIPGFIVPLEFGKGKKVTQFFLVPYFGACIHVPPPPPNQIIFVTAKGGMVLQELYDPFWISGILSTSRVENDVALAAYTMRMESFEVYEEDG